MATLYAFYNFTPNGNGGKFYFPKQAESNLFIANNKLLTKMIVDCGQNNLISFAANTYKVYDEYIDIPKNEDVKAINITYVAISADNNIMFYYVNNVKPIPQGYRLYTTIDYWATYISIANITKVVFNRSNVIIDNASELYLTEEITIGNKSKRAYHAFGNIVSQNQVRFLAIIELEESTTASGTISRTVPFLFNPFSQPYISDLVGNDKKTQINAAIEAIQNIYETGDGGKAFLKKLYIVPTTVTNFLPTFKSKLYGQNITVRGLNISGNAKIYESQYNFINTDGVAAAAFNAKYPNAARLECVGGDIYGGPKYNALKLPSFVGGYSLKVIWELRFDEFKVTITSGDDSRDISDSFQIPATANTGTLTSLERMAKGLTLMTNLAGGAFQIAAGGVGLISGTAQIGKSILNINEHRNGMYIPTGDGRNTFADIIENGGQGYLFYIDTPAELDFALIGEENVKYYGALCNVMYKQPYANLLNYLSTLENYLTSFESTEEDNIFIACSATVDNVPYGAVQAISDNLANGVTLKFI